MALPPLNGLALCAGVGMLDEGVRLAFEYLGFEYRTVAYVEREAAAAAQLVALMEAGVIDPAPVWSDLVTFDTRRWRGLVDVVTAGFPCQPHSVAGKREGLEDERWIWPDIARLIGELRPRFVLLENVPGLASTGGLDACIGDLAARGYDAEWARLSAAAVGASHERERLFIFAWLVVGQADDDSKGCGEYCSSELLDGERASLGGHAHRCDSPMANTRCVYPRRDEPVSIGERGRAADAVDALGYASLIGWREGRPESTGRERRPDSAGPGCAVGNSECSRRATTGRGRQEHAGRESESGCSELAVADITHAQGGGQRCDEERRQEPDGHAGLAGGSIFAPGPADERWADIIKRWPFLAPAIESGVCGMADGLALVVDEFRTDQLREIGNGVVALTAACAYVELARRSGVIA